MSIIDDFRTAIFGNPPQPNWKPDRQGVFDALSNLTNVALDGYDLAVTADATANAYAAVAEVAAAVQNTLSTTPSALPYEVTAITLGSAGSGATVSGEFALTISGGPAGHSAFITVSGGSIVSARIDNPGLSASNTAPTYTLPTIAGLTGATVPTATVGTIPVNRMFYAPTSDGMSLGAWGNNAGSLATAPFGLPQLTIALTALFNSIFDLGATRYLRGSPIVGGVMDSASRIALAWGQDGTLFGKFAIAVGAASNGLSFAQDSDGFYRFKLGTVEGQLPLGSAGDMLDTTTLRYYFGQRVLWATAGASYGGGAVLTEDGTFHTKLAVDVPIANGLSLSRNPLTGRYALKLGTVEGQLPLGSGGDVIDTSTTRYYAGEQVLSAILDSNGRAAQIVTKSGKVYIPGLQSSSALSTTLLYMGGDSLIDAAGSTNPTTKGLTPRIAYYLGCSASWLGVPGSYSHGIVDRETSVQLRLSGNVLPANGTATVTGFRTQTSLYATSDTTGDGTNAYWSYQPLSSPATNNTLRRKFSILGVNGTLTRTASGGPASTSESYTFTYPAMAAAIPTPSLITAASIPPSGANLYGIWAGTNDRNLSSQWATNITRWMNAHAGRRRFAIGPLNSTSEDNTSGNWSNVRIGMATLQAAFEHVIDAQSELVRWGLLAAGLTPTSQDLTDMAAGKISAQLSADGLHLNDAGYDALAQIVVCHFLRWGWVSTGQLAVTPTLWASWSA